MNKRILIIVSLVAAVFIILAAIKIYKGSASLKVREGALISVSAFIAQAKGLEEKNDLIGAKDAYQKLISEFPNHDEVMNWQRRLEDINIKLLFSPTITPKSVLYEIKPADTLTKIAREFKTTPELIMKSNNIAGDKILPGRKIKVWTAPFSIFVDKSQNILILKVDEEIVKTYSVATGKDNSTPAGNFKITNKIINPTWFKAGAVVPAGSPENILGTRWLGFNLAGYGIHGTTEPQSIGRQVTQGCVRMPNHDVEELYTIVPVATEVTIVD